VKDLLRKSSKERRLDLAKQVKESTDKMTRTFSLLNLKKSQIDEFFKMPDSRLTPIITDDKGTEQNDQSSLALADETC
jgi:hypothetical protein